MERIKQALERARNERAQRADRKPQKLESSATRVAPARIEYGQTRVVRIPTKALNERRIVAGLDKNLFGEAYKVLRTQVMRRMHESDWNTLAITSAGPGEGKSLTTVNLALALARQFSGTVLLVDVDLRRPAIHKYLGYKPRHGLTDHLLEGVPLRQCLFNPGIERLVILPAGTQTARTSELLRSSETAQFVREVKLRYQDRMVLFDLPPVLVADDALGFLSHVDCALLVIEDGKSRPEDVTRAAELVKSTTHLIGSALNKSVHTKAGYYYRFY